MSLPQVLLVEDDLSVMEAIHSVLADEGFEVSRAATLAEARSALRDGHPDCVLLDIRLAEESGLDLLPDLVACAERPRLVVMTALGAVDVACEAVRRGADDFLEKPFEIDELVAAVRGGPGSLPPLRSRSPAMIRAIARILDLVQSNLPLLLVGESRTGKECAARWVHRLGARRGPFVRAQERGDPLHGMGTAGTFYVQAVDALDAPAQMRLLAALRAAGERWGGPRIVAAVRDTTSMLPELLMQFRHGTVRIPPLRERLEDLPAIARWIATKDGLPTPTQALLERLSSRSYPGNLDELRAALREAVVSK
jgi:two-component system nitrogen regulation response regulator GlnG